MIDEKLKKNVSAVAKALDKARKLANELAKAKGLGPIEALSLVEKAIGALRNLKLGDVIEELEGRRVDLGRLANETLGRRREELRRAAEEAGWTVRRMQQYDRVGCFRVDYKRNRVTVKLGSEMLDTFNELDGCQVFARLKDSGEKLKGSPFSRDEFFSLIKDAIRIAKVQGQDRDGKVPIRKLYPLLVLARQSRNEAFMKRPSQRNFADYSICQFLYDFARFGKSGWSVGSGERLVTQTPNMTTIAKGAAITIPTLDGEGHGPQLATLWIEKS